MRALFIKVAILVTFAGIGQSQTISTVLGTPNCCAATDGLAGTSFYVAGLGGITRDSQGNLYFWNNQYVKKLSTSGIVTTAVGSGSINANVTNGAPNTINLAASSAFSGLAMDSAGNLYISDTGNNVVRVLTAATGQVTTVAGNGTRGFIGDKGPATQAMLDTPSGIALDSSGNLYIADQHNNRVRMVNIATGIINTVAGNGFSTFTVTDEVPATSTYVTSPQSVVLDSAGNLYIAETNKIRQVDTSGNIHLFAGAVDGSFGFSGDGGPATSALMSGPLGMAFDSAGNLYVADVNNERIRRISTSGIISTFAGVPGNVSTPIGDGGPAASAYFGTPFQLLFDPAGDLFVTASPGQWANIRKITPAAGSGGPGLVPASTSLTFAASVGAGAPATQSLSVTSSGTALTFSAAASTSSGGSWLSVSPGGTTPATLTVSVNPAGLAAGAYKGTITLTPASGSAVQVTVTLTVSAAGAPTFTAGGVVNATGYQNKLAPDTVFVIFGSNLGPATLQSGSAPSYPPNLAGTSITFTPSGGGAAVTAKMVYTSAGQVAGLLPSSITPGTYAVTVTYNNQTSAPQNVTVVARSFGIATSNSAGTGAAQATIGNVNSGLSLVRMTTGSLTYSGYTWTLTPAHPGDTLVLWGTGGGADAANDTGGSSGDQTVAGNFTVTVDGTVITPLYAGASAGYPGLWQINFTLPTTMAADCFASLQVTAGGQTSNLVTIAIAAAGQTSCTSSISPATLSKLDSGGTITMAGLVIGRTTFTTGGQTQSSEYVGGVINQYTAAEFLIPYSGPKVGGCTILQETYPAGSKEPSAPDAQLDAGTLIVSGPGLSQKIGVISAATGPTYNSTFTTGTLQGGAAYTLTGAGGKQVGPFTATATMPNNFTSNVSSMTTVNHTQPLTITWTGTGFDVANILIIGDVSTTTTISGNAVQCVISAGAGTFTVPTAALAYLPPSGTWQVEITAQPNAGGVFSAESGTATALTPPLVAGGNVDFGAFTPFIGIISSATVQ